MMRNALKVLPKPIPPQWEPHAGLLWERTAPYPLEDEDKHAHVKAVAELTVPGIYASAAKRWRDAVKQTSWTVEVETTGRLIIGIGNPSPLGNGIGLHYTYGVPYLPGSALKGILNHWMAERVSRRGPDSQEAPWKGVGYEGARLVSPPGRFHGALFGAPEIDDSAQASKGLVTFEDALLVATKDCPKPLAIDVLTPHQFEYYSSGGSDGPTDWYSPQPHPFVSVRPKVRFLLAVSGPVLWAKLALRHLLDALAERGIGAKTAAGYGRLKAVDGAKIEPPTVLTREEGKQIEEADAREAREAGARLAEGANRAAAEAAQRAAAKTAAAALAKQAAKKAAEDARARLEDEGEAGLAGVRSIIEKCNKGNVDHSMAKLRSLSANLDEAIVVEVLRRMLMKTGSKPLADWRRKSHAFGEWKRLVALLDQASKPNP